MDHLFIFLALAQILVGLYLLYEAIRWLGYVRRRNATDPGFYSPRTAVLCPIKGVEPGLERNLTALCEFDHQNYEVFFALASESDPATSIVKRVMAGSRGKAHLILAGHPRGAAKRSATSAPLSEAAARLRIAGIRRFGRKTGPLLAPSPHRPLTDTRIGATTTMRWLIANNNGLPSLLLAAWNAPIVTMLGENTARNFCWGGGTAIRVRFSISRLSLRNGSTRSATTIR
jgi:hypothetical protein